MVSHMKKTTLNIDEAIMTQLKEEAMRRKTTMGALVEAGIRRILGEGQTPAPGAVDLPPLPTWHGGEPLVDLADREALYEALDREHDEQVYGFHPAPCRRQGLPDDKSSELEREPSARLADSGLEARHAAHDQELAGE